MAKRCRHDQNLTIIESGPMLKFFHIENGKAFIGDGDYDGTTHITVYCNDCDRSVTVTPRTKKVPRWVATQYERATGSPLFEEYDEPTGPGVVAFEDAPDMPPGI